MPTGNNAGTIMFLENEFVLTKLEIAFGRAVNTYIEPNSEIHKLEFDQSLLPEAWIEKYKLPIVTQHEGKLLFIYRPDGVNEHLSIIGDAKGEKAIVAKGFKAKLVSKYVLNKAKYMDEPPAPPVSAYVEPVRPAYPKREVNNKWSKDRPNHSGGNSRFGGRNS
jgi:hypothetical protein